MGVDTRGYLLNCTPSKLLNFIKSTIDSNARLEEVMMYKGEMWQLYFQFYDEDRIMSIHKTDLDEKKARQEAEKKGWDYKETDHWVKINQDKLPNNTNGVSFTLSYSGSSVFLAYLFSHKFIGYVAEKDTHDDYKKIKKGQFLDYLFKNNGIKNIS
jgi:hypothetical protein